MKPERVQKMKVLTTRLFFNATPWLKDAAIAAAHSDGVGFSEYVRSLIIADLEKRGSVAIKISKVA